MQSDKRHRPRRAAALAAACVGLTMLALAGPAAADRDDDDDDRYRSGFFGFNPVMASNGEGFPNPAAGTGFDQLYVDECGTCHVPYPPAALPARSWRKMMGGLADHFGDNAELDADTGARITNYLVANAAENSRGEMRELTARLGTGDTPLRITELGKFKKEHDEIPARAFQLKPDLKLSQCDACHTKAAQNSYLERDINIPGIGPWED